MRISNFHYIKNLLVALIMKHPVELRYIYILLLLLQAVEYNLFLFCSFMYGYIIPSGTFISVLPFFCFLATKHL